VTRAVAETEIHLPATDCSYDLAMRYSTKRQYHLELRKQLQFLFQEGATSFQLFASWFVLGWRATQSVGNAHSF
jgi:hypothetical protein